MDFSYDNDGLLTSAGALTLGRSTTTGLLLADTLGPVHSAYQYTSRGELAGLRVKYDTTTLYATGYARDSLGRIVQLYDTTQGTAMRSSFVYDSVGRLVRDSVNGVVSHAFTYDANGNRLSFGAGSDTITYAYDAQDRLTRAVHGVDTTTYGYGTNGELKTKTVPGSGTTTYTYDAFGNLLTVVLPDSTAISYAIDGQNRRIGRKVNGVLVQGWLYQNQVNPVAELDSSGSIVSRFVYGSRRNVPDYMIRRDTVYKLVTDHLGSVRLVVDTATGAVAQRIDYDEWGDVIANTNPGFQPFGFAGGLADEGDSLVRFGVRDFDPSLGRWTTKDPIRFQSGNVNLYGYILNDPVNLVDPIGLCAEPAQGKFIVFKGPPPGAIACSAYGVPFLAPPDFNLRSIVAAGQRGGWNPFAGIAAVGHYGSFDFQRSVSSGTTTFYTQYEIVSNIAVGAYLYGTGMPEILANALEDTFASSMSSNAGSGDQIIGQEIGWDAAAGTAAISCGGPAQ